MKLTEVIAQYGALRKAMGEHFDSADSVLQTFCRHSFPKRDAKGSVFGLSPAKFL